MSWRTHEHDAVAASTWRSDASPIGSLTSGTRPSSLHAASATGGQAIRREKLVASYGAGFPMPSLLSKLAKPGCVRLGNQWDACGVYYAQPIDAK